MTFLVCSMCSVIPIWVLLFLDPRWATVRVGQKGSGLPSSLLDVFFLWNWLEQRESFFLPPQNSAVLIPEQMSSKEIKLLQLCAQSSLPAPYMQHAIATLLLSVVQPHGYLSSIIYKWRLWRTLYHANSSYYLKLKKYPLRKWEVMPCSAIFGSVHFNWIIC